MILHIVEVPPKARVFWVESSFSEKDTVKTAGFIWHAATNCRPGCGACAAGLGKVWWTRHEDAAHRLAVYADDVDVRTVHQLIASPLPRLRLDVSRNPVASDDALAKRFTLVERERSSTGELADDSALY